jgi:outer membrane biosynthesis protein TonB
MMVGMRFVATVLLVGVCGGCRHVQAPPTAVAPVPGMPFLVPVDRSNPERHPVARAMPSAEEVARGHKVFSVAPGVMESMLQRRPVNLAYPVEARERHLTGKVLFRAIVAEDGTVKGLTVLEANDPIFVPAAITRVQSGRYRPYLLNGKAVAVDTEIAVNFTLSE